MKAEELMLGDWVSFTMTYSSGIGKIIGIEPREGMGSKGSTFTILFVKDRQNIVHVGARAVNVTPVPLTKEILEKNGWKKLETAYWWRGGEIPVLLDMYDEQYGWCLSIDRYHIPCECKFVHQLQQAMRLCGITKEIEV